MNGYQEKLTALGHFYATYRNVDELKYKFNQQLDKLAASGFVEFEPSQAETAPPANQATLTGSGAIAQGPGSTAVGARGVYVGGKNTGSINTGTRVDTGGGAYVRGGLTAGGDFVGRDKVLHGDQITTGDVSGTGIAIGRGAHANIADGLSPHDLEPLFAPLLAAVADAVSDDEKAAAFQQAQALKAELEKGEQAEDGKIATILNGLADLAPKAVGAITSIFAAPILSGVAGPVTRFVLERLRAR